MPQFDIIISINIHHNYVLILGAVVVVIVR